MTHGNQYCAIIDNVNASTKLSNKQQDLHYATPSIRETGKHWRRGIRETAVQVGHAALRHHHIMIARIAVKIG